MSANRRRGDVMPGVRIHDPDCAKNRLPVYRQKNQDRFSGVPVACTCKVKLKSHSKSGIRTCKLLGAPSRWSNRGFRR